MRYSVVENDTIVNVILAREGYKDPLGRELLEGDYPIGSVRIEGRWGNPETQEFKDHEWVDKPEHALSRNDLVSLATNYHRDTILMKSFRWKGDVIICGVEAQALASLRIPGFWRTGDGKTITVDSLFVDAMAAFVQGSYKTLWDTIDAINSARSMEEANQIYEAYIEGSHEFSTG